MNIDAIIIHTRKVEGSLVLVLGKRLEKTGGISIEGQEALYLMEPYTYQPKVGESIRGDSAEVHIGQRVYTRIGYTRIKET